jgi:ribosomal protein S4
MQKVNDDLQKSIAFDSRAHKLRSHPLEVVRKAAERALKVKLTDGLEAAVAILDGLPELNQKTVLDYIESRLPSVAHAARAARTGRLQVNGKVEQDVRRVVHAGDIIVIKSDAAKKEDRKDLRIEVPA